MTAPSPPRPSTVQDADIPRHPFGIHLLDVATSLLLILASWFLLRRWAYPAPYPGEPTRAIATLAGIVEPATATAPLWTLLARAFLGPSLPASGTFPIAQLLSTALVALSAGLFHGTLVRLLLGLRSSDTEGDSLPCAPAILRLAALAATLLFVLFPPVWRAAQAATPDAMGILLATLAMRLAADIAAAPSIPMVPSLALAATLGAGCAESLTVLALTPFLLLFLITISLEDGDGDSDAPESRALFPLAIVAALVAVTATLALAAIFCTPTGTPLTSRVLAALKGVSSPAMRAFSAPTARVPLLLFAMPAIAAFAIAQRLISGEIGKVETLATALLAALALLQISRQGNLATWSLIPSAALQDTLAILAATVFALSVAALPMRGLSAWRDLRRPPDEEDVQDLWADPFLASRRRWARVGAVLCFVLGAIAVIAPLPLALIAHETPVREALAEFAAYERDLAHDAAPCRFLLSDGLHDLGVRLADPNILTVPVESEGFHARTVATLAAAAPAAGVSSDEATNGEEEPDEDPAEAIAALGGYEGSVLARLGWRGLFNDWIDFAPSNIALVASQKGRESWLDLLRHGRRDLAPVRRGLVMRPADAPEPADGFADANAWRDRIVRFVASPDPVLSNIARGTVETLDALADILRPDADEKDLPPFEFLGPLATPDGCEQALLHDASDRRAAICDIVHQAATLASDDEVDHAFDDLRQESDPAAARLCDLVQALLDLRLRTDPDAARRRLDPHLYNEVLDPSFWYVWGARGQIVANDYDVMRAHEVLAKFPERRILDTQLSAAAARGNGDAAAELSALRSCIGLQPGDLVALRRALVVQCLADPDDLVAADDHAERLLRRDAGFPLAHVVHGIWRLLSPEAASNGARAAERRAAEAAGHFARAARLLPPPTPRLDDLAARLRAGEDPGLTPEAARALILDVAHHDAVTSLDERLLYETALLLQHHDPGAQNSRYLIDPLLEIERHETRRPAAP